MCSLSLTDGEIASQNRLRGRVGGTLRNDGRRLPTGIVRRAGNVDSKVFVRKANKGKVEKVWIRYRVSEAMESDWRSTHLPSLGSLRHPRK